MPASASFVYLEIAEAVRRQIVSGELGPGERLPSVRQMAQRWKCTPNTVSRAYALLAQEGLVSGRRGGGTHVVFGKAAPDGSFPALWQQARLVNRAEEFLLEAIGLGYSPAEAEAALALAISRWEELRSGAGGQKRGRLRGDEGLSRDETLLFAGSHDLAVELLARLLGGGDKPIHLAARFVGSLGGLIALARGEVDIAGSHLWDESTGEFTAPFVERILPTVPVRLVTIAHRHFGLVVPAGNPQGLSQLADLARPNVRLINRQPGSGTRVWLDRQLKLLGISSTAIAGYEDEETTHLGVARAVAEGRATAGLALQAAATAYGLDFVFLGKERYDLVIPQAVWESPAVLALREVVQSKHFHEAVKSLGGYDVSESGKVWALP